jgi:hypothetical protein
MKTVRFVSLKPLIISISILFLSTETAVVNATEPCGDFGECKALIEINASDGDIGFHFLMDGDEINAAMLRDPNGAKVFQDQAKGPLLEQKLTELFAESAEPLCWADPEADPDEEIVTLTEFLERWASGSYRFSAKGDEGERLTGETELTYSLPAAPADVDFDGSVISWVLGDDLGNCASAQELDYLVSIGILPEHPEDVAVAAWEIVLEPDVEDGDPVSALKYTIRLPGYINPKQVTVPADYLASLPDDTPVKVEVGAIGVDDNATFTEEDGFCVNVDEGCEGDE